MAAAKKRLRLPSVTSGIVARLAWAAAMIACLWLAVAWSLG